MTIYIFLPLVRYTELFSKNEIMVRNNVTDNISKNILKYILRYTLLPLNR